jgi:hypothetical protein
MDGVLADDEPLGDLPVAHADGDQRDDLSLPLAQRPKGPVVRAG